jgi:uncharacterized membrane protein
MFTVRFIGILRIIIVLTIVALFAGCGGRGGGGNASAESVPTFTITGTVVSDDIKQPITVTVSGLNSETTTTDTATGNYSFSGLVRGTYTITPSMVWYKFTPPCQAVTINRADVSEINFTFTGANGVAHNISGFITVGGVAKQGVIVTLSGPDSATAASDGSGYYSFPGLMTGRYTLTPSITEYTFTPTSQRVTINGGDASAINFTAP